MTWTVVRKHSRFAIAHVEVYSGPSFIWAECVCQLLSIFRKPFVLTLHGGGLPDFGRRWPCRVSRLLRQASVVTVPSGFLGDRMSRHRADLPLVRNGLDLEAYSYRLRSSPTAKLVWVRAFHFMYNPLLAVRVVELLRHRFPDVHLSMVGPDKGDGSFKATQEEVRRFGLQSHVNLAGQIKKADIPSVLALEDIFLNTTNVDNAPVSVVEAMACGCCVVSTNAGGIPYLLSDGEDALLVPPENAGSMADAVARIMDGGGIAARMSRNARAKAAQHDWKSLIPVWESIYHEVAADSPIRLK